MRFRRPIQPGPGRPWLTLLLLSLVAVVLTACGGGASYAKASYGAQGMPGSAAPAPPEPESPMAVSAESANREEAAYGYDFADEAMGGAVAMDRAPMPAPVAKAAPDTRTAQNAPPPPKKPADVSTPSQPSSQPGPAQIASDAAAIQQMLIYTAQLRMAVFETNKSLAAVEDLAREMGGFLSHRADNQITIRVPVSRFDEAMKRISGQGDVLSRNIEVEDVTEQFLDMSLRLKNARQVRERIAALLADAKTVEESLKVEQELNRLSEEIERLEGRLKYLSDRAHYSTITVTFEPVRTDDVNPNRVFQLPFPWLEDLGLGRLMTLQ